MNASSQATSSGKLKTKFAEYDRDGNDRIDVSLVGLAGSLVIMMTRIVIYATVVRVMLKY